MTDKLATGKNSFIIYAYPLALNIELIQKFAVSKENDILTKMIYKVNMECYKFFKIIKNIHSLNFQLYLGSHKKVSWVAVEVVVGGIAIICI